MLMKAEQSTLLLIDVQEKLMPAISHGEEVADRCITLATIAGLMEVPVLATEQLPDKLGHNVEAIRELPEGRQHIVMGGCETHVCMMQTALSLVDAGYKVWVVADATGSRNEFDRDVALDRLCESGARVVTLEMVAFEWMRHCKHPQFRNIQALIK